MTRLTFAQLPPLWRSYASALLGRRPALVPPGHVLAAEAEVRGVVARPAALAAYRRACGLDDDGTLPLTYPHVLATPLQLALLASRAVPVRLLGLVHVRNRIERRAPLAAGDRVDVRCAIAGPRETERGQELDLTTELVRGGAVVWSEVSVVLARRPGARRAAGAAPPSPPPPGAPRWRFPSDAGRRYAAASGDANPIHLTALTARLFGYARPIAHGMWSLARVAAALGPEVQGGGAVLEASFHAPVLLPADVALLRAPAPGGVAFELVDAATGRRHVAGALTAG